MFVVSEDCHYKHWKIGKYIGGGSITGQGSCGGGVSQSGVFPWPEYRLVTLSFCRGHFYLKLVR